MVNNGGKSDTPDSSNIGRGAITAGHARDDAGSKPMATGKAAGDNLNPDAATQSPPTSQSRMFYSNDQKAQAQAAMQAMHDHITAIFPTICPMDSGSADDIPREDVAPADTQDTEGTDPADLTGGKVTQAPKDGAVIPATKAARSVAPGDSAVIIKAVTAEVTKQYESRIHDLEELVEKMAGEPDPAVDPFRGTVGVTSRVAQKVAHKTPDEVQQDKAASAEMDPDQLAYIRHVALHGSDPVQSRAAVEKLVALTGGKTG